MRKERREILNKMYQVAIMQDIDRQLGCGYTAGDFGYPDPFEEEYNRLYEALAATYGLDADSYCEMEMEHAWEVV